MYFLLEKEDFHCFHANQLDCRMLKETIIQSLDTWTTNTNSGEQNKHLREVSSDPFVIYHIKPPPWGIKQLYEVGPGKLAISEGIAPP